MRTALTASWSWRSSARAISRIQARSSGLTLVPEPKGPLPDALATSTIPCANCHGRDGLGRPEGGQVPSMITWTTLKTPIETTEAARRIRPAYTEALVRRAITMGFDPSGRVLDPGMVGFTLVATVALVWLSRRFFKYALQSYRSASS